MATDFPWTLSSIPAREYTQLNYPIFFCGPSRALSIVKPPLRILMISFIENAKQVQA